MDFYSIIDLRDHIPKRFRIEHLSSNPSSPPESRLWYNTSDKIPYIRANSLNLPMIAKDDNFHDSSLVTDTENEDELLIWSSSATSNYRFGKYRRITYQLLKEKIGIASNAFSKLVGDSGTMIEASEDPLYVQSGHNYMRTRTIVDEKKMLIEFQEQVKNRFFAGPSSGGNAVPTFRAITMADLPEGLAGGLGGVAHTGSETFPDPNIFNDGDQWINPATLDKYQLYNDGEKKQWVEIHAV